MALEVYNSLSRKKEIFTPTNDSQVGLYTCGPTVYNYAHIGNYRAYVFGDMLKRYLVYRGYKVKHIMNITDVDDKTIRDSIASGKSLKEFTEFYTQAFYEDRDALNIIPAEQYTKATDYINEMVVLIENLMEKGYAYKAEDGSVYFDIKKDKEYGKLSHLVMSELKENAKGRLKKDEYDKDNAEDFALWKAWDENDGDVFWEPKALLGRETSLGKGRPGWHIECSTMSLHEFGTNIDIHTGGVDLIFPHHENEIAQSECATNEKFVKYWMHNEHLLVDGKKMAKSAGNFYTLRDIIAKGVNPLAYRLWLYMAHYRTPTNMNMEALNGAETALKRLYTAFKECGKQDSECDRQDLLLESTGLACDTGTINPDYKKRLIEYMDNDLDTPQALALLFELAKDTKISNADKRTTMLDFDHIFGFGFANLKQEIIPEEILLLVKDRNQARADKNFTKSDEIRKIIENLGYEVKDNGTETKVTKI